MATTSRPDGGPDSPNAPSGSADALNDAAQDIKQRAGALLDNAKETARDKLNEQKDMAAEGVGNMAGALHEAARRRGDEAGEGDLFANLTDSAASGLDRLSSALRNKDVGGMLRDMESFARNQPVAFFGLALAAGFLAVRFLKASEPQVQREGYRGSQPGSSYGMSGRADDAGTRRRLDNNSQKEEPWTTR